jgi:hypothetical protein
MERPGYVPSSCFRLVSFAAPKRQVLVSGHLSAWFLREAPPSVSHDGRKASMADRSKILAFGDKTGSRHPPHKLSQGKPRVAGD